MILVQTYALYFLAHWVTGETLTVNRVKQTESRNVTDVECVEESLVELSERLRSEGYSMRCYSVETSDGYVLSLFRVWRVGGVSRGPPVLVLHGLLQSGAAWLDAGPRAALGYLLAAASHDLWLGNARGSHYSRRHAWLDPDRHAQYWQFCVDEIGKYDLPATIDYILTQTGARKINYIGFSQGAGTFFIMCSERPEYCDKVNVMIALAPAARLFHTRFVPFRKVIEYYEKNEDELNSDGVWEVFPVGGLVHSSLQIFCSRSNRATSVCARVTDGIVAPKPGSALKSTIRRALQFFPAGTSVHNMARYSQAVKSKYFQKFDYGPEQNLVRYGSTSPPAYNLSAVTVPTVVIYGRNDGGVDIRDIKWLVNKLPNVIEAFEVPDSLWTHVDFILSRNIPKLVYPKIKEYLDKY